MQLIQFSFLLVNSFPNILYRTFLQFLRACFIYTNKDYKAMQFFFQFNFYFILFYFIYHTCIYIKARK